jgi:type II secretory pathway component PulJ
MTRKATILIFWLAMLLGLALIAYRRFHPPSSAAARQQDEAARQHEEAVKRAQLEADLTKAAEAGRRSNTTSRRVTRSPSTARRT